MVYLVIALEAGIRLYLRFTRGFDLTNALGADQSSDIRWFCTDDWGGLIDVYYPLTNTSFPNSLRRAIERQNLNLRTHPKRLQRKTIGFSKSVEIHDKVIGEFINRHFFQLI